jgi:hypothetical protein
MPKPAPSAIVALAMLTLGAALTAWRERPPSFSRYHANQPQDKPRKAAGGKLVAGTITELPAVSPASDAFLRLVAKGVAPPVRRPPAGVPPALADLLSRVPRPEYWRDPTDPSCPVTWAHEATHGMTAELSRSGRWVIYLLDGMAVEFAGHPSVTIGQVAASVPAHQRGQVFDLYLVQQRRDWDREPLYLLDEWTCYVHGSIARRQAGLERREETERYAAEMERYCRAMLSLVERRQPDYPDLGKLREFIAWQSNRLDDLTAVLP